MSVKEILVVEDDRATREVIVEIINFEVGEVVCHVSTAQDGQEGLDKIKAIKPDLVITDISMPNKSGQEMISEALALAREGKIPGLPAYIVLSASAEIEGLESLARLFMEAPPHRNFRKPTDYYDLSNAVKSGLLVPPNMYGHTKI
jgi:CheY-like chemotaxis protein